MSRQSNQQGRMSAKKVPDSHTPIDNRHRQTPGMTDIGQFSTLGRTARHQFGTP